MDDGKLQPGAVITQDQLCSTLRISLTPMREALVLLEEYGLIEVLPRKGLRIAAADLEFVRSNFQFRHMIEVHALRLFAQSDNAAFLADMRTRHEASLAELAGTVSIDTAIDRMIATDRLFHKTIVAVLQNPAINRTHDRLQGNIGMVRMSQRRPPFRGQLIETAQEHIRIIEMLEKNDIVGAVAALEAHFKASTYRTFA
jgi:DNA-binding GntR family transcriptional regulator